MATRIETPRASRVVGEHVPLAILLASIPSLPRPALSRLIGHLVDRLDAMDPDPDLETDPDEDDDPEEQDDPAEEDDEDCGHDEGEPDYRRRRKRKGAGPGCIISDPDKGADDDGEHENCW